MSNHKPMIVAGVALAALASAVAFQSFTGDDQVPETAPAPTPPAATATLAPGADETTTGPEDASTDEPVVAGPDEAAVKVASDAVVAYTQHSWRDTDEHQWRARLRPLLTDGFAHELEEMFGADDPYWNRVVVAEQREVRTEVTRVNVSGMHAEENTAKKATLTVAYVPSTKTSESPWGEGREMTLWVDVVKDGAAWKVSSIRAAGEGGH